VHKIQQRIHSVQESRQRTSATQQKLKNFDRYNHQKE